MRHERIDYGEDEYLKYNSKVVSSTNDVISVKLLSRDVRWIDNAEYLSYAV